MPEGYERFIRDPVHGYIGLTKRQTRLMHLSVFQRLRRVSQLSLADFVYPNATHSRFSHSLGVMYLARWCADYFSSRSMGVSKAELKAFEWAALLHDIGHFPFSHVFEPAAAEHVEAKGESWRDFHVRWGKRIILDKKFGVAQVLGKELARRVCQLIDQREKSTASLVRESMTGIFSVDRLDYLMRDALHAGVPEYAIIDWERVKHF